MKQPIRCFDGNAKPHEPFWRLRNAAESESGEAEIEFYGFISEYSWFDDDITPKVFKDDLNSIGGGGPVTVRINSGGGDVFAASVIRAIMADYPGKITVKVDGLAASAAVIVAMAGDPLLIMDSAYMMIHDPALTIFWASLDISTLDSLLRELQTVKNGIVDIYTKRTSLTPLQLSRMMTAETWLTAGEAVELGFADEVIEVAEKAPIEIDRAVVNALHYVNIPEGLLVPEGCEPEVCTQTKRQDAGPVEAQPEGASEAQPNPGFEDSAAVKRLRAEAKLFRK